VIGDAQTAYLPDCCLQLFLRIKRIAMTKLRFDTKILF